MITAKKPKIEMHTAEEWKKINEELRKKYSSGSLLKKINCNGRTIKVESLDENTKERINKRVLASERQYVIEEQNALTGKTSEKVFKKVR